MAAALVLVMLGTACDSAKKATNSDARPADSAKPKSKLEQQLAAAGAAMASSAAQGEGKGPPPTGVFDAAAADAEQPAGAAAKWTMVGSGSEPKIVLEPNGLEPGARLSFSVGATAFQGPLPPLVYVLEVAHEDAKAKPSAEGSGGFRTVVIKVLRAEVDPKWNGKLEPGGDKLIAKLAGSTLTATLTPEGAFKSLTVAVSKEAKDLAYIVETMGQALEFLFVPLPKEKVGAGASWLVSDRTHVHGMELLRYRAVTLQQVQGDTAILGIDVRHYASSVAALPAGLPAGVEALRLESFGKATLARKTSSVTPLAAKYSWPIDLVVGKGAQAGGKLHADVKVELGTAPRDPVRP